MKEIKKEQEVILVNKYRVETGSYWAKTALHSFIVITRTVVDNKAKYNFKSYVSLKLLGENDIKVEGEIRDFGRLGKCVLLGEYKNIEACNESLIDLFSDKRVGKLIKINRSRYKLKMLGRYFFKKQPFENEVKADENTILLEEKYFEGCCEGNYAGKMQLQQIEKNGEIQYRVLGIYAGYDKDSFKKFEDEYRVFLDKYFLSKEKATEYFYKRRDDYEGNSSFMRKVEVVREEYKNR